MNVRARLLPPLFVGETWSWAHPLGTDQIGRDMLVRSLVGLRYSFLIGVASVAVTLLIGCALGTIAGYFGGRTDTVVMRITDAQLSIPMIILAIAVLGRLASDDPGNHPGTRPVELASLCPGDAVDGHGRAGP